MSTEMFQDLKPYPVMKDSGVQWLGKVPAHWEIKPLKRWVSINQSAIPETTDPGYEFQYLDIGAVGTGFLLKKPEHMRFGDAPSRARRILKKGDTIISTVRTYLKAALYIANDVSDLIASTGFAVLTPLSEVEPKFLSLTIQSNNFIEQVTAYSVGTAYPAIAESVLSTFHVALPPTKEEQKAIVRFVSHSDRSIWTYIRAKRRLIELLNEEMEVIVQKTVTRGLNPDVHLRPSGMDWLKEVPENWEVLRIKDLAQLKSGESITGLSISETGPYPVYGGNGLRGFTTNYTHEGDFVLIGRQGALCGNINYAKGKFWASEHAVVALPRRDFIVIWFGELLRTMNLNQYSIAAAQPGLAVERIQNLRLPVPPRDEQALLARQIEDETAGLRRAVATAQREINLLGEYRTCQIANVVTGKLDVRGIELPEADDMEEVVAPDSSIDEPPDKEESLDANE